MTTDLNLGAQPGINWPALNAELLAALPDKVAGTTYADGALIVNLADGVNVQALQPTIAALLAAHDPSALTPQQQAQAQQQAALTALTQTDFTAMTDAVQGAATLEDVRPLLLDALGALNALTLALGLKN